MIFRGFKILLLFSLIFVNNTVFSQGMTRNTGIGLRISGWNITGNSTRIRISDSGTKADVAIGGVGVGLYFFSRAYQDLFFEMSLGAIGAVEVDKKNTIDSDVNVESIVPLLFGLRYDLFSTRLSGALHPYLSFGAGPYWAWSITETNRLTGKEESIESKSEYGGYIGGGTNVVIASWFALNFDLKYHFVGFRHDQEYSGLEFGIGTSFMWGHKREVFQIKDTKIIVKNIYPAYFQFYNTYPLALVTVKNLVGYPIEVNVRSSIKGYTQKPRNSGFMRVAKGETKDIPVTAFLGKRLQDVGKRNTAILDLEVEARAATVHRRVISAQITIHSRNAWDGEMDKLGFFLTPEDDFLLNITREMLEDFPEAHLEMNQKFLMAELIFNKLGLRGIRYHPDPNIPFYQDDRVQYAHETLKIKSGDCDDLVVLYASMLESVGIQTAFVEVKDPKKEIAHLYLMFNTGIPVQQSQIITDNEKRYVIRESLSGKKSIWIPVETTLIQKGFETAWNAGAMAYLQEGILRNGVAQGWVRIIDKY